MPPTSCCSPAPALVDEGQIESVSHMPENPADIKAVVHEKYSQIAEGNGCCGYSMIGDAYDEVEGVVADADLGLGCGLPVEHAGLLPGHTVLDLGSGAGMDVFVARRVVGDSGTVIGVDFSEAMVERARRNARELGYTNVRFVLGDIEQLPLADDSVDVVISNCVINLVPDKRAVYSEIYRVLRPGGHFAISDVVLTGFLPAKERQSVEAYVGCVAGAMEREEYMNVVGSVGFGDVAVVSERHIPEAQGALSVTVRGSKG